MTATLTRARTFQTDVYERLKTAAEVHRRSFNSETIEAF
jgi:hypothetical protein